MQDNDVEYDEELVYKEKKLVGFTVYLRTVKREHPIFFKHEYSKNQGCRCFHHSL